GPPAGARKESFMIPIHLQYLVDENQVRTAVVIPIEAWERIVDDLEELDDIRALDEAKSGPQESVPFEEAVREIQGKYDT
ncbi:MAG: hypothetical protein RBU21_23790, partial [FCB group bacterium]|nr:hypothetical protein [FCB group bacterium]